MVFGGEMKLNFKPGDIVRVHTKYREIERDKEKGKEEVRERTQVFEGVVLKIKGEGESKTFTVRRVSRGIGIERIFFLSSPLLLKVEVKKRGKVRRAKLYYLREKKGKAGKIKSEEVVLSQPAEVKGEGEKKEG